MPDFAGDTNIVTLITGDDETQLPLLSKEETAVEIMNKILEQTENSYKGENYDISY